MLSDYSGNANPTPGSQSSNKPQLIAFDTAAAQVLASLEVTGSLIFDAYTGLLKANGSSAVTVAVAGTDYGFPGWVQNSQSAAYTAVATDANKQLYHPTTDNNARTFTIPSNAAVPFAIGTQIQFVNDANVLTIAINADTLVLSPAGTTASKTLAANGIATAVKVAATRWFISGFGLT